MLSAILVVLYVLLTVSGLVLFKMGSNNDLSFSYLSGSISLKFNILILVGLCCYALSFILYMVILTKFNLNYIFPITMGIVYVLVFLASIFIFKEPQSVNTYLGALMILAGVILLNVKK